MDALRRDAAILRGLLTAGLGIVIPLVLIAFTAFMMVVMPDEKRADTFLACMLLALVCLVSRAAGRLRLYCLDAGRLGIPRHAMAMRRAQCILIGLFTILPMAFALWLKGDIRVVVIFVGATAFAIYLSETLALMVLVALSLKGLAAAGIEVWALLFGVPGTVVILLASAWGIARWLRLPQQLEAMAAAAPTTLADPEHEGINAEEVDAANVAFESYLDDALLPQPLTARRLWIGLGYDPRGNWRVNAIGVFIALAAVTICHFWKHASWDFGAYLLASAIFGTYIFGRFNQLHEAWRRTPVEQSLLTLSGRWPARAAFRFVLLRSIWGGIPELLAGWLVFSGVMLACDWIDRSTVMLAAIGQMTALASALAIFLSYFAYSRVPRSNALQMVYLLTSLAGIATLLTSVAHGFLPGALIGAGLVLVPAAVAFLAFFLRPTLFPVQIDVRT